jgi:hypothetical protein
MSTWKGFLIPPLIIGITVFIKNVVGDGYMPENPHVWIDTLANMSEYIISKIIMDYSFDKMLSNDFMIEGFNLVGQPIIHGVINGVVKSTMINIPNASNLLQFNNYRGSKAISLSHYTFKNGFYDGIIYNIVGTYMSLPITGFEIIE